MQSLRIYHDKYLRRNVDLNLRSFAFICGFGLQKLFFSPIPRRASNGFVLRVKVAASD
jgi:hypothetical protein